MKYAFTDDMNEISGFGGGYEATCREMLIAAVEWLDANKGYNPAFKESPQIFGVILDDNDAAEELSKVVIDASGGDATGAMHHAVIHHAMMVNKIGWDAYVKEMTHPDGEVGILKDKLTQAKSSLDNKQKECEHLTEEVRMRGEIIADKVLGWKQYTVSNGEQKAYAPDNDAVEEIGLGDSLSSLVDSEINKLKEAEAA